MKTSLEKDVLCYRLGGDALTQIECLPTLGRMFLQTRNPGGGLGKWVESVVPLVVDGFNHAFDPDAGLGFSMSHLMAMHLVAGRDALPDTPTLDFDFEGYPAGISLLEVPGISEPGAIAGFADFLGTLPVPSQDLEEWRQENSASTAMCPCCADAAEKRARNAELHPFANILEHASICGIPLRCRLQSEHVDLTAEMIPSKVVAVDGFLIVNDLDDRCILHLNLRMVHAFRIDHAQVDGQKIARLSIYDMHGNLNFEISCEVEEIAAIWRSLSQTTDNYHQSDEPECGNQ